MALMICPDCGKEISDKASCCPQCGFLLKKGKQRKLLKVGAIINLISTVSLALVFLVLELMSSADTSIGSDGSNGITMSYELDDVSLALSVLIISSVIIFILSICNLAIKKKLINIIISLILLVVAIISGIMIIVSGFSMFICCLYWVFLFTPILNIIGSIMCTIGSCMQND